MKKLKSWLVLLLPILALAFWVWHLHNRERTGIEVELPVMGYDPRDLISGHYLSFRLAMGLQDPCRPTSGPLIDSKQERCLCFDHSTKPQAAWAGSCEQKPADCSLFLKGHCEWSGFMVGVERYYFPEGDTRWLVNVPARSTVLLSITKDGQAVLKEFHPEGRDYNDWINQQQKEHPAP